MDGLLSDRANLLSEMAKMTGMAGLDLDKLKINSGCESDDENPKKTKESLKSKMPKTLHLLYSASKVRIYSIANKFAANEVIGDIPPHNEKKVEIPTVESWDFKLGDRVRIKYSFSEFKTIQLRTLGWNAKLRTIHACESIVTARWSRYDNGIKLYTPSTFSESIIYAGLLEKVSDDQRKEDVSFSTQWKVNEYVTTIMDEKVIDLMQRRYDTIPRRYLGRSGRVIAVTRHGIFVTFNETKSFHINASLLVRCSFQPPSLNVERAHDTFSLGEDVRVLSNVKQLIKNQKGKGGWCTDMTRLAGKEVKIIHIRKDKTLRVQYKWGRSWVLNSESVASISESTQEKSGPTTSLIEDDCEFTAGDIVKIRITNNMRSFLQEKNIPTLFLEYLRNAAKVTLIDDDFDYLIRYNCDQNVSAYAQTLRKATKEEQEHYQLVKTEVKQIKVGSEVFLDIGPPNYVKAVIKESALPPQIIHALTHPSTLVGFSDDNKAVIEYKSGKRYKINKKYLTVPKKFNIFDSMDGLDYDTAKEIQEAIATCVHMIREDDDTDTCRPTGKPVKILKLSSDTTPTVDLRVYSMNASVTKLSEKLTDKYGWDVEMMVVEDAVLYVKGLKSYGGQIKVSLYFNQEPYCDDTAEKEPFISEQHRSEVRERKGKAAIHHPTKSGPQRSKSVDLCDEKGGHRRQSVIPPRSVYDFYYMPLPCDGNETTIYLPYYVTGAKDHHSKNTPMFQPTNRSENDGGTTNITFNITDSHVQKVNC